MIGQGIIYLNCFFVLCVLKGGYDVCLDFITLCVVIYFKYPNHVTSYYVQPCINHVSYTPDIRCSDIAI